MAKQVKNIGLGKTPTTKKTVKPEGTNWPALDYQAEPKANPIKSTTPKKTRLYVRKVTKNLIKYEIEELGPIRSMRFFNKTKNPKRFDNKKRK